MSLNKATDLATRALNNPSLVENMSEDTFFKFVIGVAKYDQKLAIALEMLKPFTNNSNKIHFWTAVGVLFNHCETEEEYI